MMGGHGFDHWHTSPGTTRVEEERLGRAYDHQVVMRLAAFAMPYKRTFLLSLVGILIFAATTVVTPVLVMMAINSVVGESASTSDLARAIVLLLITVAVGFSANYLYLRALARIGQNVLFDLRTTVFNHIQGLSMSFHDKSEVGRVMSRVQNDVQQLQEFLSIIALTIADVLILGGIMGFMIFLKWDLALIVLTVVPVLIVVMLVWQRYAWRSFMRVRRAIATVNANLQENISGVRVIQSLNREGQNLQSFDRLNYNHLDANLRASRLSAALMPTIEILTAVAFGLVIVFGGLMTLNGTLTVGALVAFVLFIQRFFEPLRNLTMQYAHLQRAMTSGSHIFELLDVKPEVVDKPDAINIPRIKGDVHFQKISFHYEPEVPVLHDIDLHLRPGEKVAIVGPTGAGKTTLVSLLTRLYDVTSGRITVDGEDIRNVARASLARQVGMVLQEPFLFSGTIKENIRFSHTEVTDEQIVEASKTVGTHEFITRLEQGYDTVLEERGSNLSPGQRQLISLARAMVADPSIVILDEATATVDSYTEMLIQQGLNTLLKGRTALIIAHRLSTVRDADRIIVMDQGKIVEDGNHQQLLEKDGLYARLYALNYGAETLAR